MCEANGNMGFVFALLLSVSALILLLFFKIMEAARRQNH